MCGNILELLMLKPKKSKREVDVLVVDDDINLQSLISEILKLEHISHDVAKTGKEAFSLAMNNYYRLILMDIKMPEWDGLTAIRSLDFVQEIQKVIVMSAYLDSQVLQELSKEPLVVGWLEKPFEPNQLTKMVKNVLQ